MASDIDISLGVGQNADGVVLGWFAKESGSKSRPAGFEFLGEMSADIDKLRKKLEKSLHFAGKKKESSLLRYYEFDKYPNTLLMGCGVKDKFDSEIARQVGAALFFEQKAARLNHLLVRGDSFFSHLSPERQALALESFVQGYWLASYDFQELKKPSDDAFSPKGLDICSVKGSKVKEALRRGAAVAKAMNFARMLGDRPANLLTPSDLAKAAVQLCKGAGLSCKVLGRKEIEKEGMGLLYGVGKGSVEEPQFIIIEYRGGKKNETPIALIGKGITFDSGGISIKPSSSMEDMKYDMMGASTVLGVLKAAVELELPVNLSAYIAAAENMPSGTAQKPGDVVKSLSGKTVEIINTDAEGRLILADALEYAQRSSPQAMIDFATLTGAVTIALGSVATGIMGNSGELLKRIKKSADVTGDKVWELPLFDEYDEDLKSNFADIKNSGTRDAGASKGGAFLKFFVDKKVPWVHCDIAAAAWDRKDVNYFPSKFAAGVMIRLMVNLLEDWKPIG